MVEHQYLLTRALVFCLILRISKSLQYISKAQSKKCDLHLHHLPLLQLVAKAPNITQAMNTSKSALDNSILQLEAGLLHQFFPWEKQARVWARLIQSVLPSLTVFP